MASKATIPTVSLTPEPKTLAKPPEKCEDQIRVLAYLRWEQATGGNPVDDEQARQFWLEAEKELDSGARPKS